MKATRIRDTGILPPRMPEMEERNIIIKTMPDAPRRAVPGKKMK